MAHPGSKLAMLSKGYPATPGKPAGHPPGGLHKVTESVAAILPKKSELPRR